jgi:hypothetical protein
MGRIKPINLILGILVIAGLLVTGCGNIPKIPTFTIPHPPTPTKTVTPSTTATPSVSHTTPPTAPPTTTTAGYPTTQVDIYNKGAPWNYKDPADIVMSPNVLGFSWNLNSDPETTIWAHEHGAKIISEVSLWNHDGWRTPADLPAALKTAYNTGWDGEPLYSQDMVYLNSNDPAFQQWLSDFIHTQLDQGVDGFVFDETTGSADAVYQGGGLDAYSTEGFGPYLALHYTAAELQAKRITDTGNFDYQKYLGTIGQSDKYKRGDISNVTFGQDYFDFLKAKTTNLVMKLANEAIEYGKFLGKTIVITANADPIYPEPSPGFNEILDYYTFEHGFLHNTWRTEPGYRDFEYGVPVLSKIKYANSQNSKAVVLMGIYDYGDLAAKGEAAGTALVQHFFAETYAGLGFFCYFDLSQAFIGQQFVADHPTLRPYYAFLREHPEAFNGLSFKPETAVIVPPLAHSDDLGPVDAVQGTSFVLSQANIPYDVINIGHELNYKAVIADGYAWSDAQLAKLLDYARAGGTVIAYDGRFASKNENYTAVSRPEMEALKTTGTHTLGQGKFIFFNENIGWLYWAKRDAASFNSIVNAVTPYVTGESAPAGVQVLPYVSGNNMVIHILNYNYAGNQFTTQKNVEIRIKIPDGLTTMNKTLQLLSPDGNAETTVEYTVDEGWLQFTVPELYIWSVAILQKNTQGAG